VGHLAAWGHTQAAAQHEVSPEGRAEGEARHEPSPQSQSMEWKRAGPRKRAGWPGRRVGTNTIYDDAHESAHEPPASPYASIRTRVWGGSHAARADGQQVQYGRACPTRGRAHHTGTVRAVPCVVSWPHRPGESHTWHAKRASHAEAYYEGGGGEGGEACVGNVVARRRVVQRAA